jgi:hypothetical protein
MYEFILWLAYADVIDNKIEKIKQGLVEFKNKLYGTGNAIQSITKTLDKLFQRVRTNCFNVKTILSSYWKLCITIYNCMEHQ